MAEKKKATKKTVKKTVKKVAKKTVKKVEETVKQAVEKPVKKIVKKATKKAVKKAAKMVKSQRVLRTIELNFYSPASQSVAVAGSFNAWDPAKGVMTKQEDGVWTIKIEVEPGNYEYKYVFDETSWEIDPQAPQLDSEFGPNNILQVD